MVNTDALRKQRPLLKSYLSSVLSLELNAGISEQRQGARDKLTKLLDNQFLELSTDVYDEMERRKRGASDEPFLNVRTEFHPKRNQARQKLATLSDNRFKDLASDVFYEIDRRFTDLTSPQPSAAVSPAPQTVASDASMSAAKQEVSPMTGAPPPPAKLTERNDTSSSSSLSRGASRADAASIVDASKAASKVPPAVGDGNFKTLDTLMADLGSLITPGSNASPSPTGRTSSSPLARAAPPIIAATTAISPSALAEVKSQLEMSTRDNTMLNAELDTLTKQKASLVVDMERQAKELKALQKEHEALRAEMAFNKQEKSLNREAENKYSTRVAELEEEVFQLKKDLDENTSRIADIQRESESRLVELNQSKSDTEALLADMAEVESERAKLQTDLDERNSEAKRFKEELSTKDEAIKQLEELLAEKEAHAELAIAEKLKEKDAHIEEITARHEETIKVLQAEIGDKDATIEEKIAEALAEKEQLIVELTSELASKEDALAKATEGLAEKDDALARLDAEIGEKEAALESLREEKDAVIAELTESNASKAAELEELAAELKEKRSAMNVISAEKDASVADLAAKEEEITTLRSTLDARDTHSQQLQRNMTQHDASIEELRTALAEKDAAIVAEKEERSRSVAELASAQEKLASTAAAAVAAKAERDKSTAALVKAEQALVAREEEIGELTAAVEQKSATVLELTEKMKDLKAGVKKDGDRHSMKKTAGADSSASLSQYYAENRDGKDRDLEKNAGVLQMERNSVSPKATSNTSGASPAKPEDFDAPSLRSESGRLGEAIVGAFRDATGALAHATQHETPAAVLLAMKSVVVATRAIAEVLDAYKRSVSADNARHHVDHLKSDLSDCLKDLMVETKAYATHTGPNTEMVPRVLASSDRLLHVIYGIVKLLGIKSHPAPDTTEQSRGFADERTLVMKTTKASPGYPYEELKVFLEQQTELIVQNIQKLLALMRQTTFGGELRDTITGISTVAENLVMVAQETLESTDRIPKQRGDAVLDQLMASNRHLLELGETVRPPDQIPSKQKLAAAAYQVAKNTKELVALFDVDSQ